MASVIVADSGPLIAIAHLELFSILPNVLGTVWVPDAVLRECLYIPTRPDAITIQTALDNTWIQARKSNFTGGERFPVSLGEGELAAIQMAKELVCPILIDDKLGRRYASLEGIQVIGTAGVLIKAKQLGDVNLLAPLLKTLRRRGYHLSAPLIKRILEMCGE
ncbi:MAG: DUF3368 domain-containing protein [Thiohalomonadales bacterium]